MNSKGNQQPACMVAHDSINKLAAIMGQCDLLLELTIPCSEIANRIQNIRKIATEGIALMKRHQQKLSSKEPRSDNQKAG